MAAWCRLRPPGGSILCDSFQCKMHLRRFSKVRKFSSSAHKLSSPEVEASFSNGRKLSITTGKLARFADGTATVTIGDTSVLVTTVSKIKPSNNSFLPLVVDYRQKSAAAGRIPTNFLRRELGPSEREILTSRVIDRSLRPLFPSNFNCETQIVCNMLSVDSINLPDIASINAASAALSVSDIPWNGPIGAVRLGQISNELIINPTRKELSESSLNLIVTAANQNLIIMLEGYADNILQQDLLKAIKLGTKEAQSIISAIEKLQKHCGKEKRVLEVEEGLKVEIIDAIKSFSEMRLREIFSDHAHDKLSRDTAVNEVRADVLNRVRSTFDASEIDNNKVSECFNKICKDIFRTLVLEQDLRCDGRHLDQLRDISCQVNLHKPLHGSALFQRGQTQVFCTVSLDSPESALKMDTLSMLTSGIKEKNFFLHYDFPPYATKEIGRVGGGLGRREVGHGALAEKGLIPIIPKDYDFTVRLTSEVLESNGSSSMASVCGGSLALMNASVPVSNHAAGVAIGLITKYKNDDTKHIEEYKILTDLLGIEDYMGDMDFKIAGTKKGVSALQADIKIPGLPLKIVMESVQKACDAKAKIIDIMNECISTPNKSNENLPLIEKLEIEPHKRAKLLGIGGSNLKKLFVETGVQITQLDDTVFQIFAPSKLAMDEAKEVITQLLAKDRVPELEFGAIYTAKIVELRDIGIMLTLYPNMPPALLHNTQLDQRKVAHPSALGLNVGDEIQVKYFGRDPVSGLMRLSRKVLQGPASAVVRNLDRT